MLSRTLALEKYRFCCCFKTITLHLHNNILTMLYIPLQLRFYSFTFMLLCIVIDFFLNNQPGTIIIPNLFCYKTLHVSVIFSAHHQEFSIVHTALVIFMQVSDDSFQAESGWNCSSREDARNM